MASVLDKELIQYFVRLTDPQKKSLLEVMKSFLTANDETTNKRITLEEYNRELDEAMKRISRGEFTTLEQLEKEMQAW